MNDGNVIERPRLRLVLYQPWIYLHGGLERLLLELVSRSRHDWTIFAGYFDQESTFPGFAGLGVKTLRPTNIDRRMVSVLKSAIQVYRSDLPVPPGTDAVVICCDGIGDMLTFRNRSVPLFNLCCTPLRAAFDPTYATMALKHRTVFQKLLYHGFRAVFQIVDRAAWRHYRGVVAISEEVRGRIMAGGLHPGGDRLALAYPGIDWTPDLQGVTYEPFILVSGRIMWTKNIELAISAFQAARLPQPWKLIIAGFVDHKSKPYIAQLREQAEGSDDIEFIVSPTDAVLAELVRRASFCLFTPLNEDWGIVPLEAMAQGKPVIAIDSGGPRETIVDGECGYLLPPDVETWAASIERLAGDPALVRRMGDRAHAHVQRYTWTKFVADIDDTLESWVGSGVQHTAPR